MAPDKYIDPQGGAYADLDLDGLFPERVESGDGFGPPPDTLPLCNGIEFIDRSS